MMLNPLRTLLWLVVAGVTLGALSACSGYDDAPTDGSIVVSTSISTWNVSAAACTGANPPASYVDQRLDIRVLDANGNALGDTNLEVTVVLAGNTYVFPVAFLFDDLNADGFLDNATEVMSDSIDPNIYYTKTDSNGIKTLWLRLDLGGCEYAATIDIFSGTLFTSHSFEVIAG